MLPLLSIKRLFCPTSGSCHTPSTPCIHHYICQKTKITVFFLSGLIVYKSIPYAERTGRLSVGLPNQLNFAFNFAYFLRCYMVLLVFGKYLRIQYSKLFVLTFLLLMEYGHALFKCSSIASNSRRLFQKFLGQLFEKIIHHFLNKFSDFRKSGFTRCGIRHLL